MATSFVVVLIGLSVLHIAAAGRTKLSLNCSALSVKTSTDVVQITNTLKVDLIYVPVITNDCPDPTDIEDVTIDNIYDVTIVITAKVNAKFSPSPADQRITLGLDHLREQILITFDTSTVPLFDGSVSMTLTIVEQGSDESANITVIIVDNRVMAVGLTAPRNCHCDEDCELTASIESGATKKPSFSIAARLLFDDNQEVAYVTKSVLNTTESVKFTFIPRKIGTYTATLSVSDDLDALVYWRQKKITFTVEENIVKDLNHSLYLLQTQYANLHSEYALLFEYYTNLTRALKFMNVDIDKGLACVQLNCSEHSTCVDGKCNCTHPDVYSGELCRDYVGCDNHKEACKGDCVPPDNVEDIFKCRCTNDNVTGQHCDHCDDSYCSDHGQCSVSDDGYPVCRCDERFDGVVCNACKEGWQDIGHNCATKACTDTTCHNGGTCERNSDLNILQCACHDDRTGEWCQFEKCEQENEGDCKHDGVCYYLNDMKNETGCYCKEGFTGDLCEDFITETPTTNSMGTTAESVPSTTSEGASSPAASSEDAPAASSEGAPAASSEDAPAASSEGAPAESSGDSLLYIGLVVFIAVLAACVIAYLGYHHKDKIMELFGGKKESVVEMAMRSRTKQKRGYQKLPTSIHDTMTHED